MSDHQKLKETLSALLDNEAGKKDQLELRRLARALEGNPDLIETYQRYTLTRAVLKGESAPASSADFVTRIRAALEKENMDNITPQVPATQQADFSWFKAAGRAAIAASVAVVVVYAVQHQLPIPATAPVITAVATNTQTDQHNRVLNPRLVTVSAGNEQSLQPARETTGVLPTGCAVGVLRTDSANLVWEKELPAGYVLCKQNEQTKLCESVASKIGCYLN